MLNQKAFRLYRQGTQLRGVYPGNPSGARDACRKTGKELKLTKKDQMLVTLLPSLEMTLTMEDLVENLQFQLNLSPVEQLFLDMNLVTILEELEKNMMQVVTLELTMHVLCQKLLQNGENGSALQQKHKTLQIELTDTRKEKEN
jgi:superfamily II DNA helicase RecQ